MKIALLVPDNRDEFRRYSDPAPVFGPAPTALLQGFARRNDCEVHIVCCAQRPLASPAKIAPNIFYHSLVVPKLGWLRTGYTGCVRAIRKKLREIQPDVVHGQGTERYCALAAVFSNYPNVLTIHGNMTQMRRVSSGRVKLYFQLASIFEALALRKTRGVFCNSQYTRYVVGNRARLKWLVPNAIRDEFFAPTAIKKPDIPTLLNIGTIAPHKRQVEILELARILHARGLQFKLRFIGDIGFDKIYSSSFTTLVQQAAIAGYASFDGPQSLTQIIQTLDNASALIHCPLEESFGLVVAEALSRNMKCFALGPGGMADIVKDVEGAEFYQEADWKGMSDGITRWLQQGAPKPTTASATMRERYHPDVIAAAHRDVYTTVLKSHQSAAALN